MKLKAIFLILFSFLCLSACKKQDSGPNDYLEVQIGGKTYRNDIYSAGTGFSNQDGCTSDPHFLGYLSEFVTSTFEFDGYISYLEEDSNFKNSTAGSYGVQSQSSNAICHLNLALYFADKTQANSITTLLNSGVNQVTSITKVGTTSTGVRYRIRGNFSCSFRNSAGTSIPVSGSYQYTVEVYQ